MMIELVDVIAYDGANIHAPQPGVLVLLRCDTDRSKRLRAALKDGAQYIGLVLGHLDLSASQAADGWLVSAFFTTPTPAIGVALVRYVVDGLRALAAGDEEWDRDEPLYELQRRRRREALPLALLQLQAEARARGVPSFVRNDGRLQLGYGARGIAIDTSSGEAQVAPPWERLGAVPIVAITGDRARSSALRHLAQALDHEGGARLFDDAGFDEARALLADPQLTLAVLGLGAPVIERRGVPFDRCQLSAVLDIPGDTSPAADARVRALGVPLLLTDPSGLALLSAHDPAIAALADYASCPVQMIKAEANDPEALGALAAQVLLGELQI
ncbi:MAG: DUF4938 domain-containing protein [Chloroflexales bacterium]|nr:DUF4938 domain-containing protein [Chloroflexales bacterium]